MAYWDQIGKWLIWVGVGLALLGGLLVVAGRVAGKLPLGRLPGDIHIERGGFSCYFPLATSLLLSILLTVVLNVIARLLKR